MNTPFTNDSFNSFAFEFKSPIEDLSVSYEFPRHLLNIDSSSSSSSLSNPVSPSLEYPSLASDLTLYSNTLPTDTFLFPSTPSTPLLAPVLPPPLPHPSSSLPVPTPFLTSHPPQKIEEVGVSSSSLPLQTCSCHPWIPSIKSFLGGSQLLSMNKHHKDTISYRHSELKIDHVMVQLLYGRKLGSFGRTCYLGNEMFGYVRIDFNTLNNLKAPKLQTIICRHLSAQLKKMNASTLKAYAQWNGGWFKLLNVQIQSPLYVYELNVNKDGTSTCTKQSQVESQSSSDSNKRPGPLLDVSYDILSEPKKQKITSTEQTIPIDSLNKYELRTYKYSLRDTYHVCVKNPLSHIVDSIDHMERNPLAHDKNVVPHLLTIYKEMKVKLIELQSFIVQRINE